MDDSGVQSSDSRSENDARFHQLVAEYVDLLNRGDMLDKERILSDHPDIGHLLLERLGLFREVGEFTEPRSVLGTLGDYTLRRQIGRGGMGVVYEAWQGSMDRVVALKVLPPGIAADDRTFQRFLQEARTAGKLSHPNVVSVHSSGIEEGTPWFSMELVEGETLTEILGKLRKAEPEADTPFGPKDVVDYFARLARAFAEVADGLQHAHSRGVTHRDIKPSNLIFDSGGRLRILDFGLARLEGQESLTLSGGVVGTPLYMSPEQARRQKIRIDHRSDVWSLGATMYETFGGRPPFQGKDHADTLSRIVDREPVDPRNLNPRVPRELETIILKCLRKDLNDRYGSAEALGQDLRRFVRGDAIEAHPETLADRWARRVARHRMAILGTMLVCLAGFVAILTHSFLVGRERDRAIDERDLAEHTAYVARMRLTQLDWESGNLASLYESLDRYRPSGDEPDKIDRRGWEWYYLGHLPRRGLLRTFPGSVFTWSPDGKLIAATGVRGDRDPGVTVWSVETGEQVLRFAEPGPVIVALFSPDGTRLATLGWRKQYSVVHVREAGSGKLLATLDPEFRADTERNVRTFAWHPEGRRIALASQLGEVQVWNAQTGKYEETVLEATPGPEKVWHIGCDVAWSPDGRRLARGRRGEVVVVEAREPGRWHAYPPTRTPGYRCILNWSPDGSTLAVSGENEIALWSPDGTRKRDSITNLNGVDRFDWSPHGKSIACGIAGGSVVIVDVASRRVTHEIKAHSDFVWNANWHPRPGSRLLATAGRDATIRVWNLDLRESATLPTSSPYAFAWSRDGRRFAVVNGPEIDHPAVSSESEQQVEIPRYDSSICILDEVHGEELEKLELDGWFPPATIEFSPDDRLLAAASSTPGEEARLGVWNWRERRLLWDRRRSSRLVAWSPKGELLASGDGKEVVLEAARSGEEVARFFGHDREVSEVAWRPDGQTFASASIHREIFLWRKTSTGHWMRSMTVDLNELGPYPVYGNNTRGLDWTPDGHRLIAAGGPGLIWIFDAETGEELIRVRAHATRGLSLDLSPDGRRLASSGEDASVKIWGLDRGDRLDQLLTLPVDGGERRRVAWHPDGRRLSALSWTKAVHLWDAPGYEPGGTKR